jgi:hypothetical protein
VLTVKYYNQDQQGKAAFKKRKPYTTQQQEPSATSPGGPQTKTEQGARQSTETKHICVMLPIDILPTMGGLRFPVPSMNGLGQAGPAAFSILPCWAFFGDSVFVYLMSLLEELVVSYIGEHATYTSFINILNRAL